MFVRLGVPADCVPAAVAAAGALANAAGVLDPIPIEAGVFKAVGFAAAALGAIGGASTISNAWMIPFEASTFLPSTDAPFTFSPFTSVNINSCALDALRVGDEIRLAAITLPGRM